MLRRGQADVPVQGEVRGRWVAGGRAQVELACRFLTLPLGDAHPPSLMASDPPAGEGGGGSALFLFRKLNSQSWR